MLQSRGQIHDAYIRAVNERDRWERNLNAAVEELNELKKNRDYHMRRTKYLSELCRKHHINLEALIWHIDHITGGEI